MTLLKNATSKIGSGVTPRGGDSVYLAEGIPLIRSQNVYNGTFHHEGLAFISEQQAARMDGVTVKKDDVLLNITGDSVARATMVPDELVPARVNQHVAIIRPRCDKILPSYLKYYLISPFMQATMLSLAGSGGTRKALTKTMIEGFDVPAPSIAEQQRIVDTLTNYDNLIENNRRRIKLLEESARLLYREWFVHLRFPGHEHVHFVDGVPEGWEYKEIASMFDSTSGGTPSRKTPEYFDGGINWVKTQELDELFVFDTEEHISESALKSSAAKLFPAGTLLVSIYGGSNIGRTGLLAKASASNQACVALMPKRNPDDVFFAQKWLQENRGYVIGLGQGAAQTNINQQTLRNLRMLVPCNSLLDAFTSFVRPIYEQIANHCQQLAKLREARDLLLPRLMSGQLAV